MLWERVSVIISEACSESHQFIARLLLDAHKNQAQRCFVQSFWIDFISICEFEFELATSNRKIWFVKN